jgi:hypothetical protein
MRKLISSRRRKIMMLFGSKIPELIETLCTRATYCENKICSISTLKEIESIKYTPPVPYLLLGDTGFLLQEDVSKIIF